MKLFEWENPNDVDLSQPYIYFIKVTSPKQEYRYVGKGSGPSRMGEYKTNVGKILDGKARRCTVKRDGKPQSEGNLRFRYVHLVLAIAVKKGWPIEHYPIENIPKDSDNAKDSHNAIESVRIKELDCNMNNQRTWKIEEFSNLSKTIK